MRLAQTIKLTKSEISKASQGAECIFVRDVRFTTHSLSMTHIPWGLKVYRTLDAAHKAKSSQLRYWQQGIAPEVGEIVRVLMPDLITPRYGYFTEQIEGKDAGGMVPDIIPSEKDFPLAYHQLVIKLKKLGHSDTDQHHHNIMFCNRRLRWLAVDFGPLSNRSKKKTSETKNA